MARLPVTGAHGPTNYAQCRQGAGMDKFAVVMVDATGTIRYWSTGAERAFGHPQAAALGKSLDLIVPVEYRKPHWAGFRKAMAAGVAAAEGKPSPFPVVAADG